MRSAPQNIADALWDGLRYEPPVASSDRGERSWYLQQVYGRVVAARRDRVWARRSLEPWLTAQWIMERAGGQETVREDLRFEGLPGAHSYEAAYSSVREGEFDRPFLFVAGYARSGTTSMQNLVRRAFPAHIPPGKWTDTDSALRLWWYPKHDASTARRIAQVGPGDARTLLCVRPFVDAAASWARYCGFTAPESLPAAWVDRQLEAWTTLVEVSRQPGSVVVPFEVVVATAPSALAEALGLFLGLEAYPLGASTGWSHVYESGIAGEVLRDPAVSNLPHAGRAVHIAAIAAHIEDYLGGEIAGVEARYIDALTRCPRPLADGVQGDATPLAHEAVESASSTS